MKQYNIFLDEPIIWEYLNSLGKTEDEKKLYNRNSLNTEPDQLWLVDLLVW